MKYLQHSLHYAILIGCFKSRDQFQPIGKLELKQRMNYAENIFIGSGPGC